MNPNQKVFRHLALLLFILFFQITCFSQQKFDVPNSGLNGFYSCVVKSKSFSKPRMTHIYIYEYISSGSNSKFFCQIDQYQGKRASGKPKSTYYIGSARSNGTNDFFISPIVNLDYKSNTHEMKQLKLLSNNQAEITSLDRWNTMNTITGIYSKESPSSANFDGFLNTVYSKLFERTRRVGQKEDEVIWGLKVANSGKRYGSVKQSGVKLMTKIKELSELHNANVIEMSYDHKNMSPNRSDIEDVNLWLPSLLKYKYQSRMDPLIYHFPNLKEIVITDGKTGLETHKVTVNRGFYGFSFNAAPTAIGIKEKENEERQIAMAAKAKKDREEAMVQSVKQAKEKKDMLAAERAKHNPSNEVLRLDASAKGQRNDVNNFIFGKEFTEKFQQYAQGLVKQFEDKGMIKTIDADEYFKNIFYGNFQKLSPELVSRNLLGNKDYFPEFYNAFLFYAHKKLGNSYFPNMVIKEFDIITTKTETNNFGNEEESQTVTPYKIYLPKSCLPKFNSYLNKNQFSWSGEEFLVDFEYLILSFLETYNADSLPFIQMMQNLYRYSNKLPPVTKRNELVKF